MTADAGEGGNPNHQANAWFSIEVVPGDPLTLLMEHFQKSGYEYGWVGGGANQNSTASSTYVKILDVQVEGDVVTMKYDWKNGFLTGTFENNVFRGTWEQDGAHGSFELIFDSTFSTASGWWSEDGKADKLLHSLR